MRAIIVRITGGLGNQLFQYAFAKSLSTEFGAKLQFDLSFYENREDRSFKLDKYSVEEAPIATSDFSKNNLLPYKLLRKFILSKPFLKKEKEFLKLSSKAIYFERAIGFDQNKLKNKIKNINALNLVLYLDGYWQSEKYFLDCNSKIEKSFTYNFPLSQSAAELKNNIVINQSVSLHVRRGDYLSDPATLKTHGFCSIEYYVSSVNTILEKRKDPIFYIFSDDISWCKTEFLNLLLSKLNNIENLSENNFRFIEYQSDTKDCEDLELMKCCKDNILANSTFSWWAAWLNQNPDKIVIGPLNWFRDSVLNSAFKLPSNWLKV